MLRMSSFCSPHFCHLFCPKTERNGPQKSHCNTASDPILAIVLSRGTSRGRPLQRTMLEYCPCQCRGAPMCAPVFHWVSAPSVGTSRRRPLQRLFEFVGDDAHIVLPHSVNAKIPCSQTGTGDWKPVISGRWRARSLYRRDGCGRYPARFRWCRRDGRWRWAPRGQSG